MILLSSLPLRYRFYDHFVNAQLLTFSAHSSLIKPVLQRGPMGFAAEACFYGGMYFTNGHGHGVDMTKNSFPKILTRVYALHTLPKMSDALRGMVDELKRMPREVVEPSCHAVIDEQFRDVLISFREAIANQPENNRQTLELELVRCLMSLYADIPESIVIPRNETRPAFVRSKVCILEIVAQGWTPDVARAAHSQSVFRFLVDVMNPDFAPGKTGFNHCLRSPRIVSAEEKTKVCHLVKVVLEHRGFTPEVISHWRSFMELPDELGRIFETAKLRKAKGDLGLIAEFQASERNVAACDLLRRFAGALAEMDREVDIYFSQFNSPTGVEIETHYCPNSADPLSGFSLGVAIRYKAGLVQEKVEEHFNHALRGVNAFLGRYGKSCREVILWPRGGHDNMAYGLTDTTIKSKSW